MGDQSKEGLQSDDVQLRTRNWVREIRLRLNHEHEHYDRGRRALERQILRRTRLS